MVTPVPPVELTTALPLVEPQVEGVTVDVVAISAGSFIVTVVVVMQLLVSVTVAVKVPAGKLEIVVPLTLPPLDVTVYPGVPPEILTLAVPLLKPKQVTLAVCAAVALGAPVLVIVTGKSSVHPLASVAVTV